jgi:hypothetical protein
MENNEKTEISRESLGVAVAQRKSVRKTKKEQKDPQFVPQPGKVEEHVMLNNIHKKGKGY